MRRSSTRFLIILAATALSTLAPRAHADASWQPPTTLSGLIGSYARAAFTPGDGAIVYVTFGGSDGTRAQGPYTRFIETPPGGVALEQGSYLAIGDNPAIGAIIDFLDEGGASRDNYFILGIQRDPFGRKITAIKLLKADGDGQPIVLYRVGL